MMAAERATTITMMLARSVFRPTLHSQIFVPLYRATSQVNHFGVTPAGYCAVRCASTKSSGEEKKSPARLAEVQRLLYQAEERYKAAGGGVEPIPKLTLGKSSDFGSAKVQWKLEELLIQADHKCPFFATFPFFIPNNKLYTAMTLLSVAFELMVAYLKVSGWVSAIIWRNDKAILPLVSALPGNECIVCFNSFFVHAEHVTIGYARSGGPGGQNVNKVNTKVDMRFNVKNAHWLSERVRERIMQMPPSKRCKGVQCCLGKEPKHAPKARAIFQECMLLIHSETAPSSHKGNAEDALAKLQAIIDAASYVPPPPSEETVKKIAKLSALAEQKRLDKKKAQSHKKSLRRSRGSWD
ncbi:Peptidyl-tRNA hydrolase ICT1, mitochondrial [Sesamum angolense]|uniref:Peptidyl-tRNA hydrolase ICT1, mitochondrial n=1 Tax=Sesamum angolense TaxID=2727404 RepID=A0AAE1W9S7_9LAMI|nr:Peptidyl-tRNA hydrolase ICT1, mitochondrial [Sesamum angolense]